MSIVNLKEILREKADKGAVGAFSTYDLFSAQGIIEGAENANRPVIMMIGAPVLGKPGNEEVGRLMIRLADQAKVPVAVFLDHAKDFSQCMRAIRLGFSAVMIDGSYLPFEENIELTKKVVKVARAIDVSVEGELGALAGIEDGESGTLKMTNPQDVPVFVDRTGVDALAISIGNAHGLYKGIPKLNFDVLAESAALTDTPLVLHGGTGLDRSQFAKAIDLSVKKVNIGTEIKRAYMDTFVDGHAKNPQNYDLVNVPQAVKAAVAKVVEENLHFFAKNWQQSLK